jgi:hypothetical protein
MAMDWGGSNRSFIAAKIGTYGSLQRGAAVSKTWTKRRCFEIEVWGAEDVERASGGGGKRYVMSVL